MRCGVSWARKWNHGGCGMPSITPVGLCWRMSLGGGRIPSFCSSKRCSSRLGSRGFTRMGGGPMSDTLSLSSTRLAEHIDMSLSRVNDGQPGVQAHPEIVQGTTELHHQV